jgi:nucleoside-diphosphate-sugar epimerase
MKILITGNMGYMGPVVVRRLRESYPESTLLGFDMGYFAGCLTFPVIFPECGVDVQYFGDVRTVSSEVLRGLDAVVHLAAISNDPMGSMFEDVTFDINYRASIHIAKRAKEAGVKSFVFASSCSVYGFCDGEPKTEHDPVAPLTPYAKSKIMTERDLSTIADKDFAVTCLRFATACGMSARLRLDLVLNDFVASAFACGVITILSDGTPRRPLIHVQDMARAIDWAIGRNPYHGEAFLVVNVGSDALNCELKDLAHAVAGILPGVHVVINPDAQPDKRSYRVSFGKFAQVAPAYTPEIGLEAAIRDINDGLKSIKFTDSNFRNSQFIRLKIMNDLKSSGSLTDDLKWSDRGGRFPLRDGHGTRGREFIVRDVGKTAAFP